MKMRAYALSNTFFGVCLVSLLMLSGCTLFKNCHDCSEDSTTHTEVVSNNGLTQDDSMVILSMEGKPVVTESNLEKEYQQLLQDNPQIAQVMPLMGGKNALLERLVTALSERAVLRRYISENGIDSSPEYKAELHRITQSVIDMINVKHFNKQYAAEVKDSEVKEFYDKNKETIPELLISRGGVKAAGVKFLTETDAKAFMDTLKPNKNDFDVVAKEAGLTVEDFRLVHDQSIGISPILKEKIITIKECPTLELIQLDDETYWVVYASSKEDSMYYEFSQVKEQLKNFLEEKKKEEKVTKAINDLKEKYSIKIEKDFTNTSMPLPGVQPVEGEEEISGVVSTVAAPTNHVA